MEVSLQDKRKMNTFLIILGNVAAYHNVLLFILYAFILKILQPGAWSKSPDNDERFWFLQVHSGELNEHVT